MRHSKRGVSVIVGTVLLMFIGVAGSIIIYNAFSNLSSIGPDPGTATILENVKINQVTRDPSNLTLEPSNFTVYFQNTGLVNETIDSIYILDINGSLVYVYPIDPIPLAPNEYGIITLNVSEIDTTNWAYFQAFTTRGDSDMLEVTPTGPTHINFTNSPSGAIINNNPSLPGLNNTYVNDTLSFNTTSDSGSYTTPPIHPSAAWDPVTGSREVGSGAWDIHLQHDGAVACSAEIPNPFQLKNLNITITIKSPKSGYYDFLAYNWHTNNYVVMQSNMRFNGNFIVNCVLNETTVLDYVHPNETFIFQLAVRFDDPNTGTLGFDFEDVNIVPTYRGAYNGIFVFTINQTYDQISWIEFNSCLSSNVTGTIMEFRIYNYYTGAWDVKDYYPLHNAWEYGSFQTKVTINPMNYVDPLSNEVRIAFIPYFVLGGDIFVRYDLVEMYIAGIQN